MSTTAAPELVAQLHTPPLSTAEAEAVVRRFWQRVRKAEGDGCWTFTAKPQKSGHCRASIGRRRTMLAHRLSLLLHTGELASDECSLHTCDNPPCIRPSHLFKGDRGDNARDMAAKGRQFLQQHPERRPHCPAELKARGERNHKARVTAAQVVEIRTRFAAGEKKSVLKRDYSLGFCGITGIVTGQTWKHVGGPLMEISA